MKFLLAKLFGKNRVFTDGDWNITYYYWRGKIYVTNMTERGQK